MNSFLVALSAVFPLFAFLFLGVFLRKINMTDEHTLRKMNMLCFRVFLTTSLFYNIYKTDIATLFDKKLVTFLLLAQIFAVGLSFGLAKLSEKAPKRISAVAHCSFHANIIIYGTLMGTSLYGEGNIGLISLMAAVAVPWQNIWSVIILESQREGGKVTFKKLAAQVVKNPYVIVTILAFAVKGLHIEFPLMVENVIRDIGRCATPLALMVMGGLFNFTTVQKNLKSVSVAVFARLIATPLVVIPLSLIMGFRGTAVVALLSVFATPCATSCFNLAVVMDSDADLTSQIIVFTSLVSLLTMFLWLFGLSYLNFI